MREAVACRVEALDDVLIQTWLGDDAAQALRRADPHARVMIFKQGADSILRQALLRRVVLCAAIRQVAVEVAVGGDPQRAVMVGDDPADICFFIPLPADADVYRLQRPAFFCLNEPVGTSIYALPLRDALPLPRPQ